MKGSPISRACSRLTRVDRGRTDEIVRLVVFLAIGAVVASANLVVVWLFSNQSHLPYVTYVTLATEFSILSSFALNDRITFQGLTAGGHARRVRCLRFHSAVAVGALFTIGLSTAIYHRVHFSPVAAQLAAIIIATGLNYSMHRLWTYRAPAHARAPIGANMAALSAESIEITVLRR